jgi:hypothetical protein
MFKKFTKAIAVQHSILAWVAAYKETLDPNKALEGEKEMANVWAHKERSSPAPEVYEKSLAKYWRDLGCAAEGAPHVLRTLLVRLDGDESPFAKDSPEKPKLAAAFLDKGCAGARGLSKAEIATLKAIRDRAKSQEPEAGASVTMPAPK